MPEEITQLLGEYGKYTSVIAGVLVFLALALLRNKLASLLLGLAGRVIYAKKPEKRQGFVQSLKRPIKLRSRWNLSTIIRSFTTICRIWITMISGAASRPIIRYLVRAMPF